MYVNFQLDQKLRSASLFCKKCITNVDCRTVCTFRGSLLSWFWPKCTKIYHLCSFWNQLGVQIRVKCVSIPTSGRLHMSRRRDMSRYPYGHRKTCREVEMIPKLLSKSIIRIFELNLNIAYGGFFRWLQRFWYCRQCKLLKLKCCLFFTVIQWLKKVHAPTTLFFQPSNWRIVSLFLKNIC